MNCLFVIEETTPANHKLMAQQFEAVSHQAHGFGQMLVWTNRVDAEKWMDVLDKARGQQSTPLQGFGKSKFKLIRFTWG